MGTRVLVVEDERDIALLIKHTLEHDADLTVETVERGDEALRAVAEEVPAVVILDLNLPVVGGFEVCRILRSRPATAHVRIIMLTARAAESDRVSGLELGADDYITKPFSPRELAARVKAVLRRAPQVAVETSAVYRGRHLVADFDAVAVSVDGAPVRLTRRELDLLRYLVQNRNRVLSRERLLERVWGYDRSVETRSNRRACRPPQEQTWAGGRADRDAGGTRVPLRGRCRVGGYRSLTGGRLGGATEGRGAPLRRAVLPWNRPIDHPARHADSNVAPGVGPREELHIHERGQDGLRRQRVERVEPLDLRVCETQAGHVEILAVDRPSDQVDGNGIRAGLHGLQHAIPPCRGRMRRVNST